MTQVAVWQLPYHQNIHSSHHFRWQWTMDVQIVQAALSASLQVAPPFLKLILSAGGPSKQRSGG
jgi:hypothetical protein